MWNWIVQTAIKDQLHCTQLIAFLCPFVLAFYIKYMPTDIRQITMQLEALNAANLNNFIYLRCCVYIKTLASFIFSV